MIKLFLHLFAFLLLPSYCVFSQSLTQLIDQAVFSSLYSKQTATEKQMAQYNFNAYRASYKPQLSLNGNMPVYNKDNFQVLQPDGSIKFLSRSQNNSNLGFSFTQPIAFSGGEISVNTDLNRFDDFKTKSTQYNGTPVFLRLSQPLFAFNKYKWDKKTAPLKLEESNRTYTMQMAVIAEEITKKYFDILEATTNKELAKANLHNADTNLLIEKRRLQLGVSTEDKLLQLQLIQLQSKQQLAQADNIIKSATVNLNVFLNAKSNTIYKTVLPVKLPVIKITLQQAIDSAKKLRPEFLAFERKRLEAQMAISKASAEKRQINLTASYGLNKAVNQLVSVYQNPDDQQRLSIGFSIPIVDWGRSKINYNITKLQEKSVTYSNAQEEANYIADLTNLVNSFPLIMNNISLALQQDTIAEKRFVITNRLYQLSKATLLDLEAAQTENDNSKRNYVAAIRSFWEAYYLLKKLTLCNL
jgi:outer membrane protein